MAGLHSSKLRGRGEYTSRPGRAGGLVHTFEVPEARRFRISTPILTAEIEDPNAKPHVFGSWTLQPGEVVIRESPPTLIQPAPDGRVTRTLGIDLQGLRPGEYALVLSARDETSGERLTRTEPFTVAP